MPAKKLAPTEGHQIVKVDVKPKDLRAKPLSDQSLAYAKAKLAKKFDASYEDR